MAMTIDSLRTLAAQSTIGKSQIMTYGDEGRNQIVGLKGVPRKLSDAARTEFDQNTILLKSRILTAVRDAIGGQENATFKKIEELFFGKLGPDHRFDASTAAKALSMRTFRDVMAQVDVELNRQQRVKDECLSTIDVLCDCGALSASDKESLLQRLNDSSSTGIDATHKEVEAKLDDYLNETGDLKHQPDESTFEVQQATQAKVRSLIREFGKSLKLTSLQGNTPENVDAVIGFARQIAETCRHQMGRDYSARGIIRAVVKEALSDRSLLAWVRGNLELLNVAADKMMSISGDNRWNDQVRYQAIEKEGKNLTKDEVKALDRFSDTQAMHMIISNLNALNMQFAPCLTDVSQESMNLKSDVAKKINLDGIKELYPNGFPDEDDTFKHMVPTVSSLQQKHGLDGLQANIQATREQIVGFANDLHKAFQNPHFLSTKGQILALNYQFRSNPQLMAWVKDNATVFKQAITDLQSEIDSFKTEHGKDFEKARSLYKAKRTPEQQELYKVGQSHELMQYIVNSLANLVNEGVGSLEK